MSRLPITPPKRGQLCKGDRRVLAGRNHPTRVSGERKRVPLKIKLNYSGGGMAESLPRPDNRFRCKCMMAGLFFINKPATVSGWAGVDLWARFPTGVNNFLPIPKGCATE